MLQIYRKQTKQNNLSGYKESFLSLPGVSRACESIGSRPDTYYVSWFQPKRSPFMSRYTQLPLACPYASQKSEDGPGYAPAVRCPGKAFSGKHNRGTKVYGGAATAGRHGDAAKRARHLNTRAVTKWLEVNYDK